MQRLLPSRSLVELTLRARFLSSLGEDSPGVNDWSEVVQSQHGCMLSEELLSTIERLLS